MPRWLEDMVQCWKHGLHLRVPLNTQSMSSSSTLLQDMSIQTSRQKGGFFQGGSPINPPEHSIEPPRSELSRATQRIELYSDIYTGMQRLPKIWENDTKPLNGMCRTVGISQGMKGLFISASDPGQPPMLQMAPKHCLERPPEHRTRSSLLSTNRYGLKTTHKYLFCFVWRSHYVVLRVYSCLCNQGSLLAGIGKPNGVLGLDLDWLHAIQLKIEGPEQ